MAKRKTISVARLARELAEVCPGTERTRSAIAEEAVREWLAGPADARAVQEYVAGYLRNPESRAEIAAAALLAREVVDTAEAW